jgi:hypothetical protein
LDKLLEYKRKWIQHVNRMSRNRLASLMKHYSPTGSRNHGRPSGFVIPEGVNKWPNCMTDIWYMSNLYMSCLIYSNHRIL